MFEETIAKISEACRANAPTGDGDYRNDDGILICGKCGTPRQTDVTIAGQKLRVYCACECMLKADEERRAETRALEARMQAERLRQEGFTDSAYLKMTFERDDNPDHILSKAARNYAESFRPTPEQHGIMFTGNVGTGKTFYACCIANAVIDRGFTALVTTLHPLIRALRNYDAAEQALGRIRSVDLLVLDDLGSTALNDFTTDKLFEIVDERYRSGKPLIVTTNLNPDDAASSGIGMRRIFDRLGERCRIVVMDAPSRRRRGAPAGVTPT